jgi:hypothetical protein
MNLSLLRIKVLVFLLLFTVKGFAQKTEIGGLLGGSYYWGDVNNNLQLQLIRPAATFFVRYHLDPRFAVRANLSYARVTGADTISRDSKWQTERNLSFWTDIIELSGIVEYNLIADNNKGRRVKNAVIPYVFGGLGAFYYNPKATNPITGKTVDLRPLQTNGVGYSSIALCIPLGAGVRVYLNKNWQIGFELGMRYSLSSYIDDVDGNAKYPDIASLGSDDAKVMTDPNQKRLAEIRAAGGDPNVPGGKVGRDRGKNNVLSDVYFISGVTVSYRIWPKGTRSHSGGGRAIRCPRFY